MESFYFDTSALIKLYIEEEGSDQVINLVEGLEDSKVVILDVTLLESRSAVHRRRGRVTFPGRTPIGFSGRSRKTGHLCI